MEIFNREYGRPDEEDDKEESGPADQEDTSHSLRMAEPGLHDLMHSEQRQAHITLNELLRPPAPLPEEDEEDDDEDEEGEEKKQDKKEEKEEQQEDGHSTEEASSDSQFEYPEAVQQDESEEERVSAADQEAESTEKLRVEAHAAEDHSEEQDVYHPPHDALTGSAARQDRRKFQEMMELEYEEGDPVAKAASGDNVTSPEPGIKPSAVEQATNPNVSLEPDPVHRVEGFSSEDGGRQFEGYAPGGGEAGSVPEPVSAFAGQAHQPFRSEAAGTIITPEAPAPTPDAGLREPLNALRDRFDRMDQRRRRVIRWAVTGLVLFYLADSRRKREISAVQKDLQQSEKARQAESQYAAALHQELGRKLEVQREQLDSLQSQRQTAAQERPTSAPAPEHAPAPRPQHEAMQSPPLASARHEAVSAAPVSPGELHRPQPAVIKPEAIAGASSDTEAARRAVEEALRETEEKPPEVLVTQDAWLSHVVDKETGREVTGAVPHGHEFDEERRSETFAGARPSDRSRQAHTPPSAGAGQSMPSGGYPWQDSSSQPVASDHMLYGGQEPADHSLPPGAAPADLQHRLRGKKRSAVVDTLTSPWLFLLLSLILLAYFIATLL